MAMGYAARKAIVGTLIWIMGTTSYASYPGFLPSQRTRNEAIRAGDVAQNLSVNDVEAIEKLMSNRAKPWLLYGVTSPVVAGLRPFITAYLPPTRKVPSLIRGSALGISQISRGKWEVQGSEEYAQVAIGKPDFNDTGWERRINIPFRVLGPFEDDQLLSLATFVNQTQTSTELSVVLLGISRDPIRSVAMLADGLVGVTLSRTDWSGQTITLRQQDGAWVVVSKVRWVN
jgi:hypothetical protein